jgi:hypothetical protein
MLISRPGVRAVCIALLAGAISLPSAASANQAEAAPKAEKLSRSLPVKSGKTFKQAGKSYQEFVSFQFETWAPNSLHWTAPSSIYVATNGNWFFYAEALENQRGTYQGRSYRFDLKLTYYRDYDAANKACAGPVVHSATYLSLVLKWKQKVQKHGVQGYDNRVPAVVGTARCITAERSLNPV